jgi:hypothetical protein
MSVGTARQAPLHHARQQAELAAAGARPWVVRLARVGFVAKGMVSVTIGLLALQAAIGLGGRATDARGALQTLLDQPFGKPLLWMVAVGLFGYALWRLVDAIFNPEGRENDAKGVGKRISHAVNGLAYGALGVAAVGMFMGHGGSRGGSGATQDWTARLMAQPFGQWLVGLAGVFVIGLGLYALYAAYKVKFRQRLKTAEMSPAEQKWATTAGRVGYAARGIVLGLIGLFLVQAALHANPKEAKGLDGALKALANQPYGPWLLGVVAAGLIAYGAYMFVEARYRRIAA